MSTSPPEMIPYIVAAFRQPGQDGWRVEIVDGAPAEAEAALRREVPGLGELRILGKGTYNRDSESARERCLGEAALRAGWLPEANADVWRAWNEPVGLSGDEPEVGEIDLAIKSIASGWLRIGVRSGAAEFELVFDDTFDDEAMLARFAAALRDGGFPHLSVVEGAVIATSPAAAPGSVRVQAGPLRQWRIQPVLDVVVGRDDLVAKLRLVLREIAGDIRLGPMWFGHALRDDAAFQALEAEAEAAWRAHAADSRVSRSEEEEDRFVSRYMAERMPLDDWSRDMVARTRALFLSV